MSDSPSDEQFIRAALKRLNPQFHEYDTSWVALDRIVAALHDVRPLVEELTRSQDASPVGPGRREWAWEMLARIDALFAAPPSPEQEQQP